MEIGSDVEPGCNRGIVKEFDAIFGADAVNLKQGKARGADVIVTNSDRVILSVWQRTGANQRGVAEPLQRIGISVRDAKVRKQRPLAIGIFRVDEEGLVNSISRRPGGILGRRGFACEDQLKQEEGVRIESGTLGVGVKKSGGAMTRHAKPVRLQNVLAVKHGAVGEEFGYFERRGRIVRVEYEAIDDRFVFITYGEPGAKRAGDEVTAADVRLHRHVPKK